jgi:PAS domain S-box-containing protein
MPPVTTSPTPRAVARIVLIYALFAGLWILLSDSLVAWLFPGPGALQVANTLKGLAFVAVTSLLLFFLIQHLGEADSGGEATKVGAGGTARRIDRRGLYAGIAALTLVFLLLGGWGMRQVWEHHRTHKSNQLHSIATLKAAQIEQWLAERRRDADVMRTALNREAPDVRLESFRAIMGYERILLCDADGAILFATEGAPHPLPTPLRDAVRRAIAADETVVGELSRLEGKDGPHIHLDMVAPLPRGRAANPKAGAVVLQVAMEEALFPLLEYWPLPSASAESILLRRDGDAIVNLSDLRDEPDSALTQRTPAGLRENIAARALAADAVAGELLEGSDYRGNAVAAAARPVAGTDWWLLAKIDRDEIFAEAHAESLWTAFASVLAWLVAIMLAALFHQGRRLQITEQQYRERQEMTAALQETRDLLHTLLDTLPDLVWLKDAQGRYLACNKRFADFFGAPEAGIVGKTDHDFVPAELADSFRANDRAAMAAGKPTENEEEVTFALDGHRELLQTIKTPFVSRDGKIVGVLGVARDITKLKAAEADLQARNDELERFNRATVGRELDMIELKRRINDLSHRLGLAPPYDLAAIDSVPDGERR